MVRIIPIMFLFFVGCSQPIQNISTTAENQTVSKQDKEFDELDRIDAEMKDELSPGTNAYKSFKSKSCPIR